MSYAVLAVVSDCYPPLWGRLPTCYSPVRHSPWPSASTQSRFVRLACIRHAASVRPEPGSNSHEKFHKSTWLISLLACFLPSLSAAELLVVHQVYLDDPHILGVSLFSFQCARCPHVTTFISYHPLLEKSTLFFDFLKYFFGLLVCLFQTNLNISRHLARVKPKWQEIFIS